ncbi:hypothetical protein, partial [Sphingobium sp. MK2]|uniref:hypothetical protein n=1 Tax=Sphingobium sp. MK2 TaxID=3116540 RepID=UPI0032E35F66
MEVNGTFVDDIHQGNQRRNNRMLKIGRDFRPSRPPLVAKNAGVAAKFQSIIATWRAIPFLSRCKV